jgi:hypothetical protein
MLENLPGEVQRSLIDEFRRGFHLEEVMAQIQATAAAKVVKKDHRSVDGLGEMILSVPSYLYHKWGQKEGTYKCWSDKSFLHDARRDNDRMKVKSKGTKIQVGYRGDDAELRDRPHRFRKSYANA